MDDGRHTTYNSCPSTSSGRNCPLSIVHCLFLQFVRAAGGANGGEGVGFFAVGALVPERAAQDLFAAATTAAHDNLIFLNFAAILA